MGKSKKMNIFLIMIVVIVLLGFGGYKYYNSKKYNETINSANLAMDNLEYDKAISLFNESLKYKKNGNVDEKIKLAKELKVDKQSYDKGIKLMKNKKYNEAINTFKTVSKKSEKLYSMAQDKIKESTSILINEKIKFAKENIKNKKYDAANKCLDEALKMDSANEDAKSLKKVVAIRIKEMEALKRKQQEEKKRKEKITLEQAKTIVEAHKNKNYIIMYIGIQTVPYIERSRYVFFPEELKNKQVYSFQELLDIKGGVTCQYYVDFQGNLYRDTLLQNFKCIKIN